VGAALSSNVLAVVLVGVLVVAWLAWVVRQWRGNGGRMLVLSERWGYVALATLVVFGVMRNLPFAAGLAP
jgi:hypothetical protein